MTSAVPVDDEQWADCVLIGGRMQAGQFDGV